MKRHKIAIFVVILSLIANLILACHAHTRMHPHLKALTEVHICNHSNFESVEVIRMQTPRLQYSYFENLKEIVHEVKRDIPENYFCVIVEPKNRVQEARRNVDEHNTNICSKSC